VHFIGSNRAVFLNLSGICVRFRSTDYSKLRFILRHVVSHAHVAWCYERKTTWHGRNVPIFRKNVLYSSQRRSS
jgi:hypothetical protein